MNLLRAADGAKLQRSKDFLHVIMIYMDLKGIVDGYMSFFSP